MARVTKFVLGGFPAQFPSPFQAVFPPSSQVRAGRFPRPVPKFVLGGFPAQFGVLWLAGGRLAVVALLGAIVETEHEGIGAHHHEVGGVADGGFCFSLLIIINI